MISTYLWDVPEFARANFTHFKNSEHSASHEYVRDIGFRFLHNFVVWMSENERIQPERTSIPPLLQGYWVSGILSFILLMISSLGTVFPILPSGFNVALLVGAATVFVSASLILSYLNAREQNLKTILHEIRRYSSSETSDYLKAVPGLINIESIEGTIKIMTRSAKRVALVRHAYRIALMEGQPSVAEDLKNELEGVSQFQQVFLKSISELAELKKTEIKSISKRIVEVIQLLRESESIQDPEEKTTAEKNIEEILRSLSETLKDYG